uniref:Uncharacterized protein n=2 Tax=Clytia hemisphaerica TaxID=252671 RepID=A0A7M5WWS3_9CNID
MYSESEEVLATNFILRKYFVKDRFNRPNERLKPYFSLITIIIIMTQYSWILTFCVLSELLSNCLNHLLSGGKEYTMFIREQSIGLVEMLMTFKSCKPPIQRVLEFLPRLLPREYSVANSPLEDKKMVRFVFNIIEFPDFLQNKRYGLCTNYLDKLTQSFQQQLHQESQKQNVEKMVHDLSIKDKPKVEMYFRRPTNFRFPEDPSRPLIMIGPGTGVAPFIGFLDHRVGLRKQDASINLGEAHLFCGCRYKEKDFLYRSEIENHLASGNLTQLYASHSRDERQGPSHTKYVQENIKKFKEKLLELIFEQQGAVYICGDAKHMGRDVTNTFVELIGEYKELSKFESIKLLDTLRKTKQFLEDVWT